MSKSCAIRVAPLGVVLAAMVVGCGSGDSVPGGPSTGGPSTGGPSAGSPTRLERSGARLEVRGYEADGIFVVDGFFDTKLGFMCVPGIASDGVERCVPREVLPLGPHVDRAEDGGPDYTDATCSTPLVTISKKTCADPARALVRSGTSYWRIGAPLSPAKVYPTDLGKCSERAPNPAYDYYERGAPLPASDLVAFVRHDVSVSPALRAVVVEGEDGSRLQTERDFIDVGREQPCEIALAEDGVTRCTPLSANRFLTGAFADASCLKGAAIAAVDCTRGPGTCDTSTVTEWISGPTSDACAPDRHRFYAAGPTSATGELRFGSGPAECSAPSKQSSTIVEVGAPIDPVAFPSVVSGSLPTQSRLVERTLLFGGAPVKQAGAFDPQLDDECRFEKAADGKVRCLPAHAVSATGGFADAACTTPLFSPTEPPTEPCLQAPKHARIVEGTACDPVVRVRSVTPATRAFERRDGACVEAPVYPRTFVAGDELPATTLVQATPSKR